MEPSGINITGVINNLYSQVPAKTSARQPDKESPQVNDTSSAVDTIKIATSVTRKNLETVRSIEQMHAHLNQLAKGLRETNESVNKVNEQVEEMKNTLEVVLKNFPPFSVDNKERIDALMQYTSLRKELLSLMVPPPPPAPYEKVKHLWDALFDQYGKIIPSTVPSLQDNSSDAELKHATQSLDATSSQLADLSSKVTQSLVQP